MSWNIQTQGDQLQVSCVRGGHIVHVIASVDCSAEDLGRLFVHMEQTADEFASTTPTQPVNLTRGTLRGSLSVHDAEGNDITQTPPEAA